MALTPKLEIKQSQSLLLTPSLRQAIGLLQLNNLELNEIIEQELQKNPLLERENDYLSTDDGNNQKSIDDINTEPTNPYAETPIENDADYQNDFDDFGSDTEGYNSFENADWSDYNHSKTKPFDDDNFDYFEKRLTKEKSLYGILDEQINLNFKKNSDKIIAKLLSEHLDGGGYFTGDTSKVAALLKTDKSRIDEVLTKLKTFEPSGIFAQSLSECLKIQLQDQNLLSNDMSVLLDNLPLVADRKFKELSKLLNLPQDRIFAMLQTIKSLNPKPAADYSSDAASYIIPDVYIKRNKSGEYSVELNSMTLPKILINHRYYSELKKDKKSTRFLKENLSHANFLLKALHQRATTILRVSEEIVLRQYSFFEQGIEQLKPLTLKDIAESLSLSESTISRITTSKYMSTPRGLFELKYFFSNAAGSYLGHEDTSTTTIKHKIKTLIDNEDIKHILSDDKIVELLSNEGIKIARRTVTKYRESMGLPTSGERKRLKRV